MLNSIREGLRSLAPRMWHAHGHEKQTDNPLSIIYAGPESQYHFMMGKIFSGEVERTALGRQLFSSLNGLLSEHKCSFAVVAGPCQFIAPFRRRSDLCVPWWIDSRLDLEYTLAPGKSSSLSDDLRKVRKYGFHAEHANRDDGFDFFFDDLYAPTVAASHGDAGLPSDREKRRQQLQSGKAELIFVKRDEDVVAGLLLDYREELPALREIGIRDGDRNLLKLGVITAANLFGFQHLKQKGFRYASLGLSRCFLNDGVLTYKRKWKPLFEKPTRDCFLFRLRNIDEATRAFFVHNPCITEFDSQLFLTRFVSEPVNGNASMLPDLGGISSVLEYDLSGREPQLAA